MYKMQDIFMQEKCCFHHYLEDHHCPAKPSIELLAKAKLRFPLRRFIMTFEQLLKKGLPKVIRIMAMKRKKVQTLQNF